ncbi:unnamed protein product [Closterium sp. NIES-64]|nr:unnamed protein product [Closterium sp. NIES-64]
MGMPHSLCLSLRSTLSGQEDAVLLRHALQCGTKQWGELERSGQLKRNNKSCCNCYIFLRRKFTDRFRQNFLRKHLGATALLQHIPLDGHSQALLCQDLKQQQSEHSEGVGAAALAFGGLSYEECVMAFFAPHAPLPTTMLPKLAALSGSAPCIGDGSTLQHVEWPRVGSESALLDDMLLRLCCEDPASAQRAALSAPPPTQPRAPAALCASTLGSTSSCISAVLAGSTCGTEEQEYVDACIDALWNGSNTDNNSNGADNNSNGANNSNDADNNSNGTNNGGIDNHSDRDMGALFLNIPVVHVLLSGSALTMPLPSGPQSQGPAPPCAAGTVVSGWAVE